MWSPSLWSKVMAAVALFVAGLAAVPNFSAVAISLAFGGVSLLLWAKHERDTDKIRDGLGALMDEAYELQNRNIADQAALKGWESAYQSWLEKAFRYLRENLSHTHAAVFRDISDSLPLHFSRSQGPEHSRQINTLRGYASNLKKIAAAYLNRS